MRRNRAEGDPDFRQGVRLTSLRVPDIHITRVHITCIRVTCVRVGKALVTKQSGNPAQRPLIGTAAIRRQRDDPAKQQQWPNLWHVSSA